MLQLGLLILAAQFGGALFRRWKLPTTLGSLAAGMVIGPQDRGTVELETTLGVLRALDLPAGEQLPRIC